MPGQIGSGQQGESSSRQRITQPPRTTGYMANSQNNRDKMADSLVFGWTTIDGIRFPYLMREEKQFVAVRMVEMKLLSKYPSTYPDELKNRPPLMSHYITEKEIKLLNEINREHCNCEYGNYEFSNQDLIVKLQDFEEFYSIVKKHFPDEVLKNLPQKNKIDGGWVQVNNTVVPFVFRNDFRFVPLSVIRYAAQLLVDVDVQGHVPTDDECKYFNNICKTAGLNFKFGKSTKLVMLSMVQTVSTTPVVITELPNDDPFGAAEFKGDEPDVARLPTQIAPESVPGPPGSIPPGISPTMGPGMPGLPPGMVPPNSMMPNFPPGGNPYWMNPHMGIFPGFGPGPNPFGMQQNHKGGPVSPHGEVNNNGAVKDFPERPSSRGSNSRGTPTNTGRRSSTGTPSPTGQSIYGHPPLRAGGPSAAAGAPPVSMGMPPPGLLASHGLMAGNRMMFPLLPNQSPSDYQKLLQMVQMQHQSMKSQGPKGLPPLVPADPYSSARRLSIEAPPNVTVSRTSSIPKQGSRPRGRPPIISADEPKVKPQHTSRPITTAMANEPTPHQLNPRVPIKRLDFEGKSMACLVKAGACFALMEALSRVFFPYVPMDEFRYAVEMVLSVPVLTLTDEEEHAFIQFYGLPTSKLKCKKAIKLVDFSQYLPQLRYMYKEKADAAGFTSANGSPPKGSSLPANFLPPRFNNAPSGANIPNMRGSPPKSTSVGNVGQSIAASNALKNLRDNKNKRAGDPPPAHAAPPNKKAKKRLDDMVNRLWSKNQSSSSTVSATAAKSSNSETDSLSEPSASPAAHTQTDAEEPMDQSTESCGYQSAGETVHSQQSLEVCSPTEPSHILPEAVNSPSDEKANEDPTMSADNESTTTQNLENQVTEDQQNTGENAMEVENRYNDNETSKVTEEQTEALVAEVDANLVSGAESTNEGGHSKEVDDTKESEESFSNGNITENIATQGELSKTPEETMAEDRCDDHEGPTDSEKKKDIAADIVNTEDDLKEVQTENEVQKEKEEDLKEDQEQNEDDSNEDQKENEENKEGNNGDFTSTVETNTSVKCKDMETEEVIKETSSEIGIEINKGTDSTSEQDNVPSASNHEEQNEGPKVAEESIVESPQEFHMPAAEEKITEVENRDDDGYLDEAEGLGRAEVPDEVSSAVEKESANKDEETKAQLEAAEVPDEASSAVEMESASKDEETKTQLEAAEVPDEVSSAVEMESSNKDEETKADLEASKVSDAASSAVEMETSNKDDETKAQLEAAEVPDEASSAVKTEFANKDEETKAQLEASKVPDEASSAVEMESLKKDEEMKPDLEGSKVSDEASSAVEMETSNKDEETKADLVASKVPDEASSAVEMESTNKDDEKKGDLEASKVSDEPSSAVEMESANKDEESKEETENHEKEDHSEEMVTDTAEGAETKTSEDDLPTPEDNGAAGEVTPTGSNNDAAPTTESMDIETNTTDSEQAAVEAVAKKNNPVGDAENILAKSEPEKPVEKECSNADEISSEMFTDQDTDLPATCGDKSEDTTVQNTFSDSQMETNATVDEPKETGESGVEENVNITETNTEECREKKNTREEKQIDELKEEVKENDLAGEESGSTKEGVENHVDESETEAVAVEGKVTVTEITPETAIEEKPTEETKELSDTNETASE